MPIGDTEVALAYTNLKKYEKGIKIMLKFFICSIIKTLTM